jgi:transposase-like protein
MGARRTAAIALSGALAVGGAGAAIAAVTSDERDKAEQAVLDDTAKRLDVTPQRLREALAAAQDAQLDRAVRDGELTREQADAIKEARRRSGRVLGGPHRGPHVHGPGRDLHGIGPRAAFGLRHGLFRELAEALDTTPAQLLEELRSGDSLADVARAHGTSVAAVRRAVRTAVERRLERAVRDGDLTQRQADRIRERLERRLERLDADRPVLPRLHRRRHHGGPPPPGDVRPGSLLPGEPRPRLEPARGTLG